MIALVTTYLLVFYILVPGILFRFASSLRVRLKLFQRTRTQEATFSVAVALLPFLFALVATWYLPGFRSHPFPVADESSELRLQDYRQVTGVLLATDASRLLGSVPASDTPLARAQNWQAISRVFRRQMRFLCWYFAVAALEGWLFGYLASKYGDWQTSRQRRKAPHRRDPRFRTTSPALFNPDRLKYSLLRLFNWAAAKLILPNISEWHMLLTDFSWPKRDAFFVSVDILQNNEHLYQGRVADYFIDPDGKLTGILLKNVSRFDRQAYQDAVKFPAAANAVAREDYWREIPSSHFYIGYGSIVNLNVRFAPRDQTLISLAGKILEQTNANFYHVDVEDDERDEPGHGPPDLYS